MIRALAPANLHFRFLLCKIPKAKWIVLRGCNKSGFDRVLGDIRTMGLEVLLVQHLHFRESSLPHLAFVAKFMRQTMRKPTLDQLHRFFDCHIADNLDEKMDVIGHDHKIVELDAMLGDERPQNVDEEVGIALRLQ